MVRTFCDTCKREIIDEVGKLYNGIYTRHLCKKCTAIIERACDSLEAGERGNIDRDVAPHA